MELVGASVEVTVVSGAGATDVDGSSVVAAVAVDDSLAAADESAGGETGTASTEPGADRVSVAHAVTAAPTRAPSRATPTSLATAARGATQEL